MTGLTVSARDLADALHNIAPHASPGDTVYELQHLLIEVDGQQLAIVGTDRYTLARQDVPLRLADDEQPEPAHLLLHIGGIKTIITALDKAAKRKPEPAAVLDLEAQRLTFGDQDLELDGNQRTSWPRYRALWPTDDRSGHAALGIGARHLAKYAALRLHGSKHDTHGNLRLEPGPTPTRPVRVTPVALEDAGVAFQSIVMPVRLADQ